MIQAMGVKIVLVHGFRPQVNEQLRLKGQEPRYYNGMRVTDSIALDCAQEAAGQLRYEIEAAFSQGLPNTPMAGARVRVISGNFLTARPWASSTAWISCTPVWCARSTWKAFAAPWTPKPWCWSRPSASPTGEAFNLSMEEVATRVAIGSQGRQAAVPDRSARRAHGPCGPADENNPIDTELPLDAARRLLAQPRLHSSLPMWAFICSTVYAPASMAWNAAISCPSRPTERCCWRSMCTTASAPW